MIRDAFCSSTVVRLLHPRICNFFVDVVSFDVVLTFLKHFKSTLTREMCAATRPIRIPLETIKPLNEGNVSIGAVKCHFPNFVQKMVACKSGSFIDSFYFSCGKKMWILRVYIFTSYYDKGELQYIINTGAAVDSLLHPEKEIQASTKSSKNFIGLYLDTYPETEVALKIRFRMHVLESNQKICEG